MSYKKFFCFTALLLFAVLLLPALNASAAKSGYYYQIKIYHFKDKEQQQLTDAYLKDQYLPTLHKMGFKDIGVFKPVGNDTTDLRTYVFIPFVSWKSMETFDANVYKTDSAAISGKNYIDAESKNPPYLRMETIVLKAFATRPFPAAPKLTADHDDRIYELRSYESPTEKYHYNKVRMFNSGETDLFDRLKFNPVFYGDVIAGSHMPNLMYLTTFNSKEDRDKHWDAFSNDPQWKDLSGRAEFQNNVSKADIIFLHPTIYSDF
ncbi:NIPSNAP family protein [Mucilaginibacter segetis]|uniref:NIPSNAP family protein n=1 Tax=Mucilaginibacter segetis TaxID=2793071 RepID=A0A934PWK9_9SPHI|nr:NIPSNAP family protein [Mucilaginibacter segetis]MBK0381012.1 NIPSNAP family protein [Mucilaginibacter segetis]